MKATAVRLASGIVLAVAALWLVDALYSQLFLVRVDAPAPPLHVPKWLEPMESVARLLRDLIPAVVLGAVVRWYSGVWGFLLALVIFFSTPLILSVNDDFYYSVDGLAQALGIAILWGVGAVVGQAATRSWMPNTSLERSRA
jgi:hypothetical protein